MTPTEHLTNSINQLSQELARLCQWQKHNEEVLREIKEELKEIRTLSSDVTTLKSERSTLRWVIGLLIPGSLAAGGASGWLSHFIGNGSGS